MQAVRWVLSHIIHRHYYYHYVFKKKEIVMKVQVTQERLAQAMLLVGRVATSRSALPVLANVLMKTVDKQLQITATNLDIAITHTLPCKITEEGALTVPARLLSDYVNSLPSGNIDLTTESNKLHLASGEYTSTINGVSPEEFPTLPSIGKNTPIEIEATELKTALQQTILTASSDETRPILTGAYIHTHEKQIYIAATDSYRLSQKELKTKPTADFALVVPATALSDLLRIIGDGSGPVTFRYDDTQVEFVFADTQLITRQIDGTFPAYRELIPEKSDVSFTISKPDFVNITKVASLFARESAGSITLEVGDDHVSITSVASQVGENTSKATAKITGEGSVTLNSRYLLDALNVIDSKEVTFRFSGKISPCVLSPVGSDDYIHIIMPLKS
jgi:DNA polymerase-3 subunit beta